MGFIKDTLEKVYRLADILEYINTNILLKDKFDLEIAKKSVKNFLNQLMVLTQEEQEFLNKFVNRQFIPELLFENSEIIDRIKFHPMALWKIN